MERTTFGRTGRQVSRIGLGGAWLLGRRGDAPLEEGVGTVRHALGLGVDYLDTAACYIGGRSETVLGAALEAIDADVFLATKFGHRPKEFDFSREAVLESIRESLCHLRRSAIDLIQIHTPIEPEWDALFGKGGAVEGMREAQERGWCRFLGITGRDLDFLRRCIETDVFDGLLLFNRYDLLDRSGAVVLAEAKAHGMGVAIGSPLRMGLFGAYREAMWGGLSDEERTRIEAVEALVADEPDGLKGAAIRYLLANEAIDVVLSGASAPEEIEEIVRIAERRMSSELVAAIDDVIG